MTASIGEGGEERGNRSGAVGPMVGMVDPGEKPRNPSPTGERLRLSVLGEDEAGGDVGIDVSDEKPGRDEGMRCMVTS